ncbi:Transcription initiation factor IIA large subunit [Nakaseomyces bracarensis]|uniref:Transcription initiation factor IIA large subunit n=1 Tax=Nakaseomyces bracarensis TaxID=273131 RepID=A0ABR4NUA0_9SACH
MSNIEASKVYEVIVNNVINEVREDFESAGIDEQTLQDLKRVWQEKLTETKVTQFTWDPVADPVMSIPVGTSGDNSSGNTNGLQLPGGATISTGDNTNNSNNNNINSNSNTSGDGLVLPGGNTTSSQEPSGLDNDNDNETNDAIKEAEASVDGQIKVKDENEVKFEMTMENADISAIENSKNKEIKEAKRSALLDADEVGSELDDSDDNYLISEGEDEGPDENILLCLYDKVTRTKARWKCTLKDGLATVNRKDYSFQKAQVEAEWV